MDLFPGGERNSVFHAEPEVSEGTDPLEETPRESRKERKWSFEVDDSEESDGW
jgi:hypothetical protein